MLGPPTKSSSSMSSRVFACKKNRTDRAQKMRPHRALKVHLKKNFSSFSKAFCQFYSYHFCLFFHFRNSYFLSYLDLGMILLFYPFFNFFLSFQPILILPISYHFGNLFNLFAIYAILLLTFYITFRHFTPIFCCYSASLRCFLPFYTILSESIGYFSSLVLSLNTAFFRPFLPVMENLNSLLKPPRGLQFPLSLKFLKS